MLRNLSIRQSLMLPFATLVALLLLIAWLEGGAEARLRRVSIGALLAQILHILLMLAAAPSCWAACAG